MNAVISFLIVAFAIFLLIKSVNKMKRKEEEQPAPDPTDKDSPFCLSSVPIKATRCGHCTSELATVAKTWGVSLIVVISLFVVTGFVVAGQALAQTSLGNIESQSRSIRPIENRPLAPEIAFKDRNGRDWGFVEFRGRPAVVTFWATWCPVCAGEIPRLDRLQAKLGQLGVSVIALSIDRGGIPAVENYYARHDIQHLKAYTDAEAILASVMGITGVPTRLHHRFQRPDGGVRGGRC